MEETNKISKIIELIGKDNRVAIFTHNTPDPDAMASAMSIQWILKKSKIDSDIFYSGEISHPQNQSMLTALNVVMLKEKQYSSEKYNKIIVVDTTRKNSIVSSVEENLDEKIIATIDHHPVTDDAPFTLIEQVGSCSTLIVEMIRESNIEFENDHDKLIATALSVGIRTDTNQLTRKSTTKRDFEALVYVSDEIVQDKFQDIIEYPIPQYIYELEKISQENSTTEGSTWVGGIGIIPETKKDALPMLADRMIRMQGITTSVVIAIVGDSICISVRTKNSDASGFAQKLLGENAGGHSSMAAGSVPLGCAFSVKNMPEEIRDDIWNVIKKRFFHQVIHIASGN